MLWLPGLSVWVLQCAQSSSLSLSFALFRIYLKRVGGTLPNCDKDFACFQSRWCLYFSELFSCIVFMYDLLFGAVVRCGCCGVTQACQASKWNIILSWQLHTQTYRELFTDTGIRSWMLVLTIQIYDPCQWDGVFRFHMVHRGWRHSKVDPDFTIVLVLQTSERSCLNKYNHVLVTPGIR